MFDVLLDRDRPKRSAVSQISRKVLTEELRSLEGNGLVLRAELGDERKRVRYALTPKGKGLAEILGQMFTWAMEHRPEIRLSQSA
ncbi:winged helix-turn-helix transcriptional regulator [Roseibium suaedae]|uniref:winged helix-turn-helix transcriptional regulator n=1 Tax=Roseibium suaedae TaxID=735517 RepID=UPI0009350B55|nr:winged helix-turn-helix transcriptional regulator [Roseibium suaedae]